jgi:hypothetical protein
MKPAALLLALACAAAHAEFFDGNELLERCTAGDTGRQLTCQGYVAGVFDAGYNAVHCAPHDVRLGQIVDMAVADLRRHPETRHKSADVLLLALLQRTWPCAARSTPGVRTL